MSEPWKSAVWDHPQNGTRYCARRRNPASYSGFDFAPDELDGPATWFNRKEAQREADRLNQAAEQPAT